LSLNVLVIRTTITGSVQPFPGLSEWVGHKTLGCHFGPAEIAPIHSHRTLTLATRASAGLGPLHLLSLSSPFRRTL